MKEFFLNLLSNLDKLAGLRQIEKIYASHSDQNEAKREINALLDLLVNICQSFPYIPEQEQKRIIHHCIITDPELTSLNARIVYKWLNTQKDKYYKELAHIPTETTAEPIAKDDPRYEEHLQNWLKALEPMQERINVTSKRERALPQQAREGVIEYTPLSKEEVDARENHRRELSEKSFRDRHPNATEEEVKQFLESI